MLGSHTAEVPQSCRGALLSLSNSCFNSLKHPSIFPINACPLWPATRGTATSTLTEEILLLMLLLKMTVVMDSRDAGGILSSHLPRQTSKRPKDPCVHKTVYP